MNESQVLRQGRQFGIVDWLLMLGAAVMWGSSFLMVRYALVDLDPGVVVWLRLLFGAATLALFPASWRPLKRRGDWRLIALLSVVWMAVPMMLLNLAQQRIDSSMAGMINSAAPLITALIAAIWFRQRPSKRLAAGLIVGFAGIVFILLPSVTGAVSLPGMLLMITATTFYGISFNISAVAQSRNGALAVIWRSLLIAFVLSTPLGIVGLGNSTFTPVSLGATAVLGIFSTGLGFICFTTLINRVGPSRASINIYLTPVVAMLLGALVAGETLHLVSFIGIALVLLGAFLASRGAKSPVKDAVVESVEEGLVEGGPGRATATKRGPASNSNE